LINELIDGHGVFHVTIAGGEPLLHPGILRIMEESFLRHGDRLVLLSNGTHLLNEHFFTQFSAITNIGSRETLSTNSDNKNRAWV
jgi:organic radical activating enzyme